MFKNKILLGSGSPRRQFLLKELGFDFYVSVSNTPEIPSPGLIRGEIAVSLAEEKANALILKLKENEILLTADTIVWLDNSMIGKPAGEAEAFEMLMRLNGKTHQVYTGVCLYSHSKKESFFVETHVTFRNLNETEIKEYIEIYKPFDKAGSYGAQESLPEGMNPCSEIETRFLKEHHLNKLLESTLAKENKKLIPLIDQIKGSYFNVMGLPIVELYERLNLFI